jgi:hypothetical protein
MIALNAFSTVAGAVSLTCPLRPEAGIPRHIASDGFIPHGVI